MKKAVLSALVVAALAGTATAQVSLELRLVRQTGTPANPGASNPVNDVDVNSSVTTTAGSVLRFEVQYRILNLVKDADFDFVDDDGVLPDGLSAATLQVSSINGSGSFAAAQLSRNEGQLAGIEQPPTSDTSGIGGLPNSVRRGLHNPYRGGLADANDNSLPSNGIFLAGSFQFTPVAIAATHQGNPNNLPISDPRSGDINSNADETWFGLYTFNFTVGGSNTVINVGAIADLDTGNRFGYFNDSSAVPLSSPNAGTASYEIIVPAPGSVALLGLGGLLVARRRRA